ncbi:MAG: cytochrome-c peroxidase, partial [Polyangiaceae bacterium]|nr:cytochrome-c peroxidase [Polyangiaceae bacterium]
MKLGRRLFHDPKLSGDETVSCATCHSLDHGGAEARRTSTGIGSQVGPINSPTVLNAEFNFKQFWDGRAADLAEQAAGPITNPLEMGGDWPQLLERLNADPTYVNGFAALYPDGITQQSVIDAIVQYERSLVTPSRFDAFMRGDDEALAEAELRGLQRFKEVGCTSCHTGVNLGGQSFQKMGLVRSYFEERGGELTEADLGRYNVTRQEADKHFFKVPTLRNVTVTDPYFHDGSEPELASAVRTMARVQLGRNLSDEEVSDLVAFLGALTGELPAEARLPEGRAPEGAEAAEAVPHDVKNIVEA